MRALCWKELRENVKWALLAMAALGVAELYALHYVDSERWDSFTTGVTICKTAFLQVTTFGCAATGLLLGLIQVLPELRRDRWAALLHRPATRGVIFCGKAAGGLLLYALATAPPFLFCVWQAATPGHFAAPFVPAMTAPGIADICTGLVYYFAALGLALQRDKWIGLRAFPFLAAFHCSCFVTTAGLFRVAVEAALAMAAALCVAAWGTMLHQEKFSARPWPAKVAFLAMVFYGAVGLGDFGLAVLRVAGPEAHTVSVAYLVASAGVPVRATYKDNVCVSVTDPAGRPVAGREFEPAQVYTHRHWLNTFSSYIGDSHGWKEHSREPGYRESTKYLQALQPYDYPEFEQWFYLAGQRSLIGYRVVPRKPIGRLDQGGLQPPEAEPLPMASEAIWEAYDQSQVYIWDGKRLTCTTLSIRKSAEIPLPGPGHVFGLSTASYSDAGGQAIIIGFTLRDRLLVYDTHQKCVANLPYHRNVDRWGCLGMGVNGAMDRFYLWYQPSLWIDGKIRGTMPSYLEEVDRQGVTLHSWTLPPTPPDQRTQTPAEFLDPRLQSPAFFFGGLAYEKIGAMLGSARLAGDLARRLGRDWRWTREFAIYSIVLSLALAAVTLAWARRAHLPRGRAWAWAAFVLAFNIAGFIAFRLAADWPRTVACPRCRRSRPIHDELCPHCGAQWPPPETRETDVFDGVPSLSMGGAE